jgi:Holliday junction resolvase
MNNKKLGTQFEQEFCTLLAQCGYWAHFISPDRTGSQPFDVIACKDNKPYAFDCKTCESDTFNISRLEDNQIMAFEKWLRCNNEYAYIAVKHKGLVRLIDYTELKEKRSIRLADAKWFGIVR